MPIVAPTAGSPRARWAVLAAGVVAAVTMVVLGLWQMQVFEDRGDRLAAERAAQPPVALLDRIPPGGDVGDVYGRNVSVDGTWQPQEQVVVVDAQGGRRVLTGLTLPDGRVLPVVRGVIGAGEAPPVPATTAHVEGVFMPSEPAAEHPVPAQQLGSVRLATLAQRWPQQLAPGFVTLSAEGARAQGLEPATVTIPRETGSLRNLGYAMQWWVFAIFALAMSLMVARSMRPSPGTSPATGAHAD